MAFIRSVIRGVGAYLPKRIMTNDDLSRLVDTSDAWIRERTGIEQRHIAADGELTSDLGIAAARQALVRAGIDPVEIDLVVCATSTPDRTFPATGVRIQAGLGISKGAAFDVQAVCSGFVYALAIADNFLKVGTVQARDRRGCGDLLAHPRLDGPRHLRAVRRRRRRGGAGGAVAARAAADDRGILATRICSDGRFEELLYVDGGPGSPRPPATCA